MGYVERYEHEEYDEKGIVDVAKLLKTIYLYIFMKKKIKDRKRSITKR